MKTRKILSLLLALCLLLTWTPVISEEADYVTVTVNDGHADVAITVDEVGDDDGDGISLWTSEEYVDAEIDGYEDEEGNLISLEIFDDLDEAGNPVVDSVSIESGPVTENVGIEVFVNSGYDEYLDQTVNGVWVNTYNIDVDIDVAGGVSVIAENDPEGLPEERETLVERDWVFSELNAVGVYTSVSNGDVSFTAEDVTVTAGYQDNTAIAGKGYNEDIVLINAKGLQADFGYNSDQENPLEGSYNVGDVTVAASTDSTMGEHRLTGIEAEVETGYDVTIDAGNVTVTSEIESETPYAEIYGVDAWASTDSSLAITAEDLTVEANVSGNDLENVVYDDEGVNAIGVSVTGVRASGNTTLAAGAVEASVTVEGENIFAETTGIAAFGETDVTVDSVTVKTVSEGPATAIGINATYADVKVSGDVEASAEGTLYADAYGIQAVGAGDVSVEGNVAAAAESSDDEAALAIAVLAMATEEGGPAVAVQEDVTAEGANGVGIQFAYTDLFDDYIPSSEEGQTASVTVGGTVSGTDIAVKLIQDEHFSVEDVDIAVWEAKENEDGEIARVVNEDDEVDTEASAELEASINYIVKFTTEFMFKDITTDKGNTVTLLDKEYHTANEDENVYFVVTEDDEHILDGVFYNADDKSTLIQASNLKKTDGKYTIAMARGGAMKLGIKWHEHEYTNYTDDGNATCGADGTETGTCSCGAKNTRTKPGSATGKHTEDTKTRRENYVAPTETTEGGYDEVTYCKDCGAEIKRVHVTLPKLQPSAPAPAPVPGGGNPLRFKLLPKTPELANLQTALQEAETNGDVQDYIRKNMGMLGELDESFTRVLGSVAATLTGDMPNAGRVTVTLDPSEKEPDENGMPGEPWISDLPEAGTSLQLLIITGGMVFVQDANVSADNKIELSLDKGLIDQIYGRTFTIVVLAEP